MAGSSAQEWIDYLSGGGRYEAIYAPETRRTVLAAGKRITIVSAILCVVGVAGILVVTLALPRGWAFLAVIAGILAGVSIIILIMGWRITGAFERSTRPESDGGAGLALAVTSDGLEFSREVAVPWSAIYSISFVDSSEARAAALVSGNWKQRIGTRLGGGSAVKMGSPAEFVIVAVNDGAALQGGVAEPVLKQRVRLWKGKWTPTLGDIMVPLDPAVSLEQRTGLRFVLSAMAAERGVPVAHHLTVYPVLMELAKQAEGFVAGETLLGVGALAADAPVTQGLATVLPPPTLADLVDDAIFLSTEVQAAIGERWGQRPWRVDFSAQQFLFEGEPEATFGLQLVGSAAQGPGTWMWGWNNVNGFPEGLIAIAQRVKDAGEQWGVPELAENEVPLTDGLPLRLTLAAQAVSGQYGHIDLDLGRRTRAWVLISGPELALAAPTMLRSLRILGEGIAATTVADHRRALASYARLRGLALAWNGVESALLQFSDGAIRVKFDELGRISGLATQ